MQSIFPQAAKTGHGCSSLAKAHRNACAYGDADCEMPALDGTRLPIMVPKASISAYFGNVCSSSNSGGKADVPGCLKRAKNCREQMQQIAALFDYFVGSQKNRRGQVHPNRFGGL